MAYHLWYSEKSADMHAGKTEEKHWNGAEAWTDTGYAIAADKDGNLIQYMDAGERVQPAVQGHDRHAYIVATAREKEDFRVLVNRKGEINEDLAAELDIKADLDVIKSLVPQFYTPKPTSEEPQAKQGKYKVSDEELSAIMEKYASKPAAVTGNIPECSGEAGTGRQSPLVKSQLS